ncbi:hypothetical protein EYF80_010799 [Liparis tanakae]|uniref:Uncharacterized protein n=1 Tax=Liparis tanakae TaxID=230148 RepID=A0A4Z2IM43_9TELE|nr:hypothetical protein EYF80_010799 [Liparis tanakae]
MTGQKTGRVGARRRPPGGEGAAGEEVSAFLPPPPPAACCRSSPPPPPAPSPPFVFRQRDREDRLVRYLMLDSSHHNAGSDYSGAST